MFKEKLEELIWLKWVYNFYKQEVEKLKKSNYTLSIADFDYTLFCRDEQIEKEPWLKENRWDLWPKYIFENIWMSKFLEKYYENREIPKNIIKNMNTKHDVILTAWQYDFQIAKVNRIKELDDFKKIITKTAKDKIIALIRYIIFELKFIPEKITIYEDRIKYFMEYKDLIENILWSEIEIILVEMNWNEKESNIKKIA
jgi:hypothetical protein